MKEIDLGPVVVRSNYPEGRVSHPHRRPRHATMMSGRVSIQEAERGMADQLRRPQWVPCPIEHEVASVLAGPDGRTHQSTIEFRASDGRFFVVKQMTVDNGRNTPRHMNVPYEVHEGEVDGHRAAFYRATDVAGNHPLLVAAWERDGFLFRIFASGFSLDDIKKIGASLA